VVAPLNAVQPTPADKPLELSINTLSLTSAGLGEEMNTLSPKKSKKEKRATVKEPKWPQIVLSVRLDEAELEIPTWREWIRSLPAEAKDIKIEGMYKSFSTLLLIRLPVSVWNLLPDNGAYSFVGYVTSENLARLQNQKIHVSSEDVVLDEGQLELSKDDLPRRNRSAHQNSEPTLKGNRSKYQDNSKHFIPASPLRSEDEEGSQPLSPSFPITGKSVPSCPPSATQPRGNPPKEPEFSTLPKSGIEELSSACLPCKRSHLPCDTQRPCFRCLSKGKQANCVDYQHEKTSPTVPTEKKEDSWTSTSVGQSLSLVVPTSPRNSEGGVESKEKLRQSQIRGLEEYLGVSRDSEGYFTILKDARLPGTCEWYSRTDSFLKWKDFAVESPSVLWITGPPASGKSVLAGYVIEHLQSTNAGCSYFFFSHGNKSKSRVGTCLRSLAFQMACTDTRVCDMLLEMQDEINFDKYDERAIWRKIFLFGIFQIKIPRHYWVIDALDECTNPLLLIGLLAKLDESTPLRVLITSRKTSELELGRQFRFSSLRRFQINKISTADTVSDIKLLIQAKTESFIVKNNKDRAALFQKILARSEGNFLWTHLFLDMLSNCFSEEGINHMLKEMPTGIEQLYQRILESISQATFGKEIIKAILTWTTCATRPLSTDELGEALNLELNDMVQGVKTAIASLCGHLVYVDKFGKVQFVHETAREFLLSENTKSEFAINERDAHTQIARTCLKYLLNGVRPQRSSKQLSVISGPSQSLAGFPLYACEEFSYHLRNANSLANDAFFLVNKFLQSTSVLSWIEVIAQTKNLAPLIPTANNLQIYFNTRSEKECIPYMGCESQIIKYWTTDIIYLVAKFG
jgi:hypothetical protein